MKEKKLQEYANFYLNQTFRLAASELGTIINKESSEAREKKAFVEKMTYESF